MSRSTTRTATKDGVRLKYTGRNVGAITLTNPDTGNAYAAGNNPTDRYQVVHPDDVAWLTARGFVGAADEAPATADQSLVASTGEQLPTQPPAIENVSWTDALGLNETAADGLTNAGVTTLAQAQALSDEELDAIPGVGPATIQKIREAK
jgi:hypothetical protein